MLVIHIPHYNYLLQYSGLRNLSSNLHFTCAICFNSLFFFYLYGTILLSAYICMFCELNICFGIALIKWPRIIHFICDMYCKGIRRLITFYKISTSSTNNLKIQCAKIHCRCSILNPPKKIFPIRNLKLIHELLSIKACQLIQQGLFCVKTCEFGSYGSCEKIACKCGEVHNRIQFLYPCNHFPSAIKTDNKNS